MFSFLIPLLSMYTTSSFLCIKLWSLENNSVVTMINSQSYFYAIQHWNIIEHWTLEIIINLVFVHFLWNMNRTRTHVLRLHVNSDFIQQFNIRHGMHYHIYVVYCTVLIEYIVASFIVTHLYCSDVVYGHGGHGGMEWFCMKKWREIKKKTFPNIFIIYVAERNGNPL